MAKTMAEVIMTAMGCERRAHYGNVEQPFCGTHGNYGQWPCMNAIAIAAALSAAGYGLVADAKREAWDEGFTACAYEHMAQDRDPSHPITRTNPCRKASNDDQ